MLKEIFGNMAIYGMTALVLVALLLFIESKKVSKIIEGLINLILPLSLIAVFVGLCGYIAMENLV